MGDRQTADRLLLLSCSQTKLATPGLMTAMQRYDGPMYKVMRKLMRTYPAEARLIDVYILSAEFGLIPAGREIPDYDRRMTPARAEKLWSDNLRQLKQIVGGTHYKEMFICMGRTYRRSIFGYKLVVPADMKVKVAEGGIGTKLAALRVWLYGGIEKEG